jgi:putative hydrolase of the HAD superfamily
MTPEQKKALKIISPHLINEFKKSVKGGMKGLRKNAEYMLDHFHRKGIKLGVISNTDSIDYVLLRLQYNDIYKYFEPSAVYLSAACQSRKPDPAMMIEICKELGVKPSEAVYVGDTISRDVIGSRAAKYRACIRIHSKNEAGSDAKTDPKLDTPFVVDSLTEVVEIVDELNTKKGANKHLK